MWLGPQSWKTSEFFRIASFICGYWPISGVRSSSRCLDKQCDTPIWKEQNQFTHVNCLWALIRHLVLVRVSYWNLFFQDTLGFEDGSSVRPHYLKIVIRNQVYRKSKVANESLLRISQHFPEYVINCVSILPLSISLSS